MARITDLYHEQMRGLRVNIDDAVMTWAKKHAPQASLGDVVGLIGIVSGVAEGHARDCFDLGRNAEAITEEDNKLRPGPGVALAN